MSKSTFQTVLLKDYQAPTHAVSQIQLTFDLFEDYADVTSVLDIIAQDGEPLVLDGEALELLSIMVDGEELTASDYQVTDSALTIKQLPKQCQLTIKTRTKPQENTTLNGLYKSNNMFCTQCEAHGFRRITYYLDRPDIMTKFTTTIFADKQKYPVLLSNGNLIAYGDADNDNDRHWVKWEDPFKKPSYLFALVAGTLDCLEDSFTTCSGREITLKIFVEPGNIEQCHHAMASLKKSMRWDEDVYGREYDLDLFMIVAVSDFNMGAMENKGLNLFNSKYILADPSTATDLDYQQIEGVVAHEYFHNWTGNRVTCRDWFQLSLKEGLTVFRDQEFSRDMQSRDVNRIQDVVRLRQFQFAEDAGPMAHPVRPESYVEINNFYTATVYEKGAEVIRMMATLLGKDKFRKGMDLYFDRHDGQAVTIEDFVKAMEDANAFDLSQFRFWYSQAGTPKVSVETKYDIDAKRYEIKCRQQTPNTPGQTHKVPVPIPLTMALLDDAGEDLAGTAQTLLLTETEQQFTFDNISAKPHLSMLRDFSAPVIIKQNISNEELCFLMANDNDGFSRWEAGQILASTTILGLIENTEPLSEQFIAAYRHIIHDEQTDNALRAELLSLPSEAYLAEQMTIVDPVAIQQSRNKVKKAIAEQLQDDLFAVYQSLVTSEYKNDAKAIGNRSLKNSCLAYLVRTDKQEYLEHCYQQFQQAYNMTDVYAALSMLTHCDKPERQQAIEEFYSNWSEQPLVVDKWFSVQAYSELPGTLASVKQLMQHQAFDIKNPNKVRALIGAFCSANPAQFHAIDGSAYVFLADQIIALNKLNPQIAARLLTPLTQWQRYDQARQQHMRQQLERIINTPGLSKDVHEIVNKSL